MTGNTTQKFPLSRTAEERLKMFYMIVRPDTTPLIKNERVRGVIAYRPEDAIGFIKETEPVPRMSIVWTGNYDFIDDILKKTKEEKTEGGEVESTTPTEQPKKLPSKQQFLWNIQLVSDEMTEGVIKEEDQENLKRIIKTIYEKI